MVVALLVLSLEVGGLPYRYSILRTICTAAPCAEQQLDTATGQTFQASGILPTFYATYTTSIELLAALVWFVMGAVVFSRKSDDRMALLVAYMLVTWSTSLSGFSRALARAQPMWLAPHLLIELIGGLSLGLFLFLFPDGRFVPRWARWIALVSIIGNILSSGLINELLQRLPLFRQLIEGLLPVSAGLLLFSLFLQVYRYRKVSDTVTRQQTKWVVFGMVAALGGFILLILPSFFVPVEQVNPWLLLAINSAIYGVMLLIPISIGIAILRYRLFDIDIIIRRTLVYSTLTLTLGLVYFGCIVLSRALVAPLTGGSELTIVASTLLIAALFTPLRRRIQIVIDKRFYRRKYDAAKVLAAFGARLRTETDLDTLTDDLLTVVDETMQPTHVSLWLREPPPARSSEQTNAPGP
jgi:hypothetical protein